MEGYELSPDHNQRLFVVASYIADLRLLLVKQENDGSSEPAGWQPIVERVPGKSTEMPSKFMVGRVAIGALKGAGVRSTRSFSSRMINGGMRPYACKPDDTIQDIYIPAFYSLLPGSDLPELRKSQTALVAFSEALGEGRSYNTESPNTRTMLDGAEYTTDFALRHLVLEAAEQAEVIQAVYRT